VIGCAHCSVTLILAGVIVVFEGEAQGVTSDEVLKEIPAQ